MSSRTQQHPGSLVLDVLQIDTKAYAMLAHKIVLHEAGAHRYSQLGYYLRLHTKTTW